MNEYYILIINNDQKNLRILKQNFVEAQFKVDEALNESEAIKSIKSKTYDAILTEIIAPGIDGYRILEEIQKTPHNQLCAVIFLTQKTDIWNRTKAFRLGVKDYIIKPIHVKEIVGRVNMILNRIHRHKMEMDLVQKQFTGRLEELNLFELIQIFGFKRKSGILSIYNENNCTGKVYFKNGAVINASTSLQKGEEAIYKMMAWKKGRFSMLFTEASVTDEIPVSNMCLLLQGAKRMDQREQLLRQLPSLDAVLVTTSNFKKIIGTRTLAKDLEYFVSLFDGEHTLGRIIDESKYDEITTLQRILKLYELGFLHTLRDFKAPVTKSEDEIHPSPSVEPTDEEMNIYEEEFALTEEVSETLLNEDAFSPSPNEFDQELPTQEAALLPEEFEPMLFQDFSLDEYSDFSQQDYADFRSELMPQNGSLPFNQEPEMPERPAAASETAIDLEADKTFFVPLDFYEQRHPADVLLNVDTPQESISTQPMSPAEQSYTKSLPDDEISKLERENILIERFRKAHGGVLILSTNPKICKEMVHALTGGEIFIKKLFSSHNSDIYMGTADFKGGHLLNIIGATLNNEFMSIIDFFSSSLLGYMILIDAQQISWNYYHYLLRALFDKIKLPIMIVMTRTFSNDTNATVEYYRKKFMIRQPHMLKICEELTPVNSKRLIFNLIECYYNTIRHPENNLRPATL